MIGAVLNGGTSTRMGSDKSRLQFNGRTLLEGAVDLLEADVDSVIVCGGDWSPHGTELVPDPVERRGPLGGIASALRHADGDDVLVLAVDLPLVSSTTVGRLVHPGLLRGQVRVARTPRRLHPLCGAYAGDVADLVWGRLDADDRSLMACLRSVPHLTLVDVPESEMVNINTSDDYQSILAS